MPPSDCVKNVKGIFRLTRGFTAEAIDIERKLQFHHMMIAGFLLRKSLLKGGKICHQFRACFKRSYYKLKQEVMLSQPFYVKRLLYRAVLEQTILRDTKLMHKKVSAPAIHQTIFMTSTGSISYQSESCCQQHEHKDTSVKPMNCLWTAAGFSGHFPFIQFCNNHVSEREKVELNLN